MCINVAGRQQGANRFQGQLDAAEGAASDNKAALKLLQSPGLKADANITKANLENAERLKKKKAQQGTFLTDPATGLPLEDPSKQKTLLGA